LTIVDTNILLDLVTDDPIWSAWSLWQLERAALNGPLIINDVIYAELSVRFEQMETLEEVVVDAGLTLEGIPRPALFLAGKAFQIYRTGGGVRTGVLPDFFIGAHAAVTGRAILTRDQGRYRRYFPGVALISPLAGGAFRGA
jgi:predicted nucleic acid-binding protein